MKAIIIEDESLAAQSLQSLIQEINREIEIIAVLQTIEESVEWFSQSAMPDLVFMDIHLADGSSFAIFDKVDISCPIIFTTAYDEYALKAFEVNSIDYLLKPINKSDLERVQASRSGCPAGQVLVGCAVGSDGRTEEEIQDLFPASGARQAYSIGNQQYSLYLYRYQDGEGGLHGQPCVLSQPDFG